MLKNKSDYFQKVSGRLKPASKEFQTI